MKELKTYAAININDDIVIWVVNASSEDEVRKAVTEFVGLEIKELDIEELDLTKPGVVFATVD